MKIMGYRPSKPDRYFIKDKHGVVEATIEYIQQHPDWYAYSGACEVNGGMRYTFELIT